MRRKSRASIISRFSLRHIFQRAGLRSEKSSEVDPEDYVNKMQRTSTDPPKYASVDKISSEVDPEHFVNQMQGTSTDPPEYASVNKISSELDPEHFVNKFQETSTDPQEYATSRSSSISIKPRTSDIIQEMSTDI